MNRSTPVAIQRPAAPCGTAMRIRNSGLPHGIGPCVMFPENVALPRELGGTGALSCVDSLAAPASQTRVPVTDVTGPVVPLFGVPLITNPCTSNDMDPVFKSTLACPVRAVHAK